MKKTLYYLKSIPHLMNQMNINREKIKNPKLKYSSELQGIKKVHVQGNRNYLFSSLDMIAFDGSFCSYAQRQLVVDHINYNKDVYIDNIEAYFSKYVEKKLGNIMWNSQIIWILKHYWCLNWTLVWFIDSWIRLYKLII